MIPVKIMFLDNEKKRKEKKSDSYFCDLWYHASKKIKYFTFSLNQKN
jgi:hypothetical protein